MFEKIVTNLEVSRKLKKLGIVQESCFYWVMVASKTKYYLMTKKECDYYLGNSGIEIFEINFDFLHGVFKVEEKISAWTVSELGAMWGNPKIEVWIDPDGCAQEIIEAIKYGDVDNHWINKNLLKWRGDES